MSDTPNARTSVRSSADDSPLHQTNRTATNQPPLGALPASPPANATPTLHSRPPFDPWPSTHQRRLTPLPSISLCGPPPCGRDDRHRRRAIRSDSDSRPSHAPRLPPLSPRRPRCPRRAAGAAAGRRGPDGLRRRDLRRRRAQLDLHGFGHVHLRGRRPPSGADGGRAVARLPAVPPAQRRPRQPLRARPIRVQMPGQHAVQPRPERGSVQRSERAATLTARAAGPQ